MKIKQCDQCNAISSDSFGEWIELTLQFPSSPALFYFDLCGKCGDILKNKLNYEHTSKRD